MAGNQPGEYVREGRRGSYREPTASTKSMASFQDDDAADYSPEKDNEEIITKEMHEEEPEEMGFVEGIKLSLEGVNYTYLKTSTSWFLDKWGFSVSMDDILMLMTIFVLFANSIDVLAAPKEMDDGFMVANSICMFVFILEFFAQTWSRSDFYSLYPLKYKGYIFSFFWYLDIISIVSMWFDIPWIANPLGMGGIADQVGGGNNANITKAGRVARLVRLVRLVRLYKLFMEKRRKLNEDREIQKLIEKGDVTFEEVQKQRMLNEKRQSALGEQLSNIITQKVIILVLTMVIIIPVLQPDGTNNAPDYGVRFLQKVNANAGLTAENKLLFVRAFQDEMQYDGSFAASEPDLVFLYMSNMTTPTLFQNSARLAYVRSNALVTVTYPDGCTAKKCNCWSQAIFDYNPLLRESAMYSIVTTIFIGIMLVVGSVTFNEDSQKLVLTPIDRMMNMVDAVARDPMMELHFEHEKGGVSDYETMLLESTIEKITNLLRVGFGEAGAGIISANLSNSGGGSAAVDPLLPGIRVYVIVGFCDIHHFEECLVKLSDGILIFVNTIASIVHESVCAWEGQCNKNLGNAFVILWRIADELSLLNLVKTSSFRKKADSSAGEGSDAKEARKQLVDLRRVPGIDVLADHALIGYLKIIAEINRNKALLAYRNDPRLTSEHDFKVRMGFGLHAGWAIEGAVGSIYKVDATYLSPHVNMAARLETSSRQYGVPLLASHFVHELMSATAQSKCRRLDICTVKGSEVPINIYTYDCLQDQVFRRNLNVAAEVDQKKSHALACIAAHIEEQVNLQNVIPIDIDHSPGAFAFNETADETHITLATEEGATEAGSASAPSGSSATGTGGGVTEAPVGVFLSAAEDSMDVFERDDDLVMLRAHITPEFLEVFKEGVDTYLLGKWDEARDLLSAANDMMKLLVPDSEGDGPCLTLLEYMEERNWTAPSDWQGYRPLTSK